MIDDWWLSLLVLLVLLVLLGSWEHITQRPFSTFWDRSFTFCWRIQLPGSSDFWAEPKSPGFSSAASEYAWRCCTWSWKNYKNIHQSSTVLMKDEWWIWSRVTFPNITCQEKWVGWGTKLVQYRKVRTVPFPGSPKSGAVRVVHPIRIGP